PRTRRKTLVFIEDREIPLWDVCNDVLDSASIKLPDLFSINIRELELDFMNTEAYQARVEYITLVEDLLSAIYCKRFEIILVTLVAIVRFSFGEDLLPNNLELISGSIVDNPYDSQSVCGALGTIQRKERCVSKHLVLENESGTVKYHSIKLSCDSNESQMLVFLVLYIFPSLLFPLFLCSLQFVLSKYYELA
ncbi:hypothetical protein KSF78_0009766, partial [Schistosoma japonicum]